jgi:Zn-dependent peptidase ImmA (M78 family)
MGSNDVPHRSRENIERRAERALAHYLPRTLIDAGATPVAELAKLVQNDLDVSFTFNKSLGLNSKGQPVLGACYFSPKLAIFIDPSLTGDNSLARFRFTLAHELGHLTLHRTLSLDFTSLDASPAGILDGRQDLWIGRRKLESPRDWLEWQANSFASSLLMPSRTYIPETRRQLKDMGVRRPTMLYFDDQQENGAAFRELAGRLAHTYQTSRTSTQIRLRELGLVEDRRAHTAPTRATGPVSMSDVLRQLVRDWPAGDGPQDADS